MSETTPEKLRTEKQVEVIEGATVRLVGDSGDGMQLMGTQLTNTSALAGNDIATFPDYPAEIRAPRGTRAGVSGFQVQFASTDIFTPGDRLDALVAMNPAALATNIADLKAGGALIVNTDSFEEKDLRLARLESNPLEDGTLDSYRVITVPLTSLTRGSVGDVKNADGTALNSEVADRSKNFFALGLVYWLYGRELDVTVRSIQARFGARPEIAEANMRALKAGWFYGETTDEFAPQPPKSTTLAPLT